MRCTPKRTLFICTTFIFSFFLLANYDSEVDVDDDVLVNYVPKNIPLNFVKYSEKLTIAMVLDDRRIGNMGGRSVRLLIASNPGRKIKCIFPNQQEVNATIYEMSENHMQTYGVFYANCLVPSGIEELNTIKIFEEHTEPRELSITYRIPEEMEESNLPLKYSVCVPYMFGGKYDAKRLIEFMELNRLLGVNLVTLYVNKRNMTEQIRTVTEFYESKGWLQTVQFSLPIQEEKIWYHGQLLAITDCLNRHIGVSKYLAFHDLDEFVIPLHAKKVPIVLDEFLSQKVGSIRIPTMYMYTETEEAPVTLNNLQAHGPNTMLTKCVVRPHMVFEQGIHHTSRVIQDSFELKHHIEQDNNQLRIFHYKKQHMGEKEDTIARVFGNKLRRNYEAAKDILEVKKKS